MEQDSSTGEFNFYSKDWILCGLCMTWYHKDSAHYCNATHSYVLSGQNISTDDRLDKIINILEEILIELRKR